jgi:hypothetical protein
MVNPFPKCALIEWPFVVPMALIFFLARVLPIGCFPNALSIATFTEWVLDYMTYLGT